MGRTNSPTKRPTQRTLSRPNSASPGPVLPPISIVFSDPQASTSNTAITADDDDDDEEESSEVPTPAQIQSNSSTRASSPSQSLKRPLTATGDEESGPPRKAKRKRKNKKKKRDAEVAFVGGASVGNGEEEEGEIDEWAGLIMFDTTPSAVKPEAVFGNEAIEEATAVIDQESLRRAEEAEDKRLEKLAKDQEAETMRLFAKEVAGSDESSLESDEDDDDEDEPERGAETKGEVLYDNEMDLQKAIQHRIVDDSAAKVTGRYYKEVDLTRSCGLCGEQGHSSRDCPHSQCFTCGDVDGDHEARNCPVTLVCSACGARGHFARECRLPHNQRNAYGTRCAICGSGLHVTVNCPSLWRDYDTSGVKPKKNPKITYACGNCGSTKDHFIDDCLLPRMHPIRNTDPSPFNKYALFGSSQDYQHSNLSRGATGSASSAKRRGAGGDRRPPPDEEADDDWFASRQGGKRDGGSSRKHNGGTARDDDYRSGGGGGGSGRHRDSYERPRDLMRDSWRDDDWDAPPSGPSGFGSGSKKSSSTSKRGEGGDRGISIFGESKRRAKEESGGTERGTHIHFSGKSLERFGEPSSRGGSGGGSRNGSPRSTPGPSLASRMAPSASLPPKPASHQRYSGGYF